MLFNSYEFIFLFFPITYLVFFRLGKIEHKLAAGWLAAASLFFYGWWNPAYVALLALSVLFNYTMGLAMLRAGAAGNNRAKKQFLILAIFVNLGALAYFKYAHFLIDNFDLVFGSSQRLADIILPLGISFFTFTQITYLVDTYQGKAKEYSLVHYGLFVTYFPHLIAGPILHHSEMMPQFGKREVYRLNYQDLATGLTIFVIGLFKKVIIADGVGANVAPLFDGAQSGLAPGFVESWCGALAYTFQLYFDFSGYSDMAIGMSLMFGIRLPINFNSPYKAVNIIDFWRRWHMTLSRFLRDYLYIPLGGNRKGRTRRYLNLMVTMLLGGLWHGAGWTFVLWGGLHGVYLIVNHAWRALKERVGLDLLPSTLWSRGLSCLATFAAVVAAWVIFRAANMEAAFRILRGMAGLNGFALPDVWLAKWGAAGQWFAQHGVVFANLVTMPHTGVLNWIWILMLVVWIAPNSQQMTAAFKPALIMLQEPGIATRWQWRPTVFNALIVAGVALVSIANLSRNSAFLYFQF